MLVMIRGHHKVISYINLKGNYRNLKEPKKKIADVSP